jgi:aminoglycoside 2'-N-acetyltransferase I
VPTAAVRFRRIETLLQDEARALRRLLDASFGERFSDEDWQHALGGVHFVLQSGDEMLAHAAVVYRELRVLGDRRRTGYVEAVATASGYQRRGFGSRVMHEANAHILQNFELGALSTGRHGFYERLGWKSWRGPSSVWTPTGEAPTPEADGSIMVLPAPTLPDLDVTRPISCEWRTGDFW